MSYRLFLVQSNRTLPYEFEAFADVRHYILTNWLEYTKERDLKFPFYSDLFHTSRSQEEHRARLASAARSISLYNTYWILSLLNAQRPFTSWTVTMDQHRKSWMLLRSWGSAEFRCSRKS